MTVTTDLRDTWLTTGEPGSLLILHSYRGLHEGPKFRDFAAGLKCVLDGMDNSADLKRHLSNDELADLTLIYERKGLCLLKSDVIRSRPLFYRLRGADMEVADYIPEPWKREIAAAELTQFVAMGYVIGDKTVYVGVKALQSAEIVITEKAGTERCRTFCYHYDDDPCYTRDTDPAEAGQDLNRLLINIFSDMIATLPKDARLVVPLSGGHDSRIVLNYLYKLGYRNVLCYTYGVQGTLQARVSHQVAKVLDYEWHFIEYSEDKWQQLRDTGEFDRYLEYGFRGVSNPLISDLLPVWELKREGRLCQGDIFVPGHGLDYLAGNDLTEEDFLCENEEQALELVIRNSVHLGYLDRNSTPELWDTMAGIYRESGVGPVQFHLHFFWQEDEAKFIVNSNRLYEYFGYSARTPLLDIRLIRFWLSVEQRLNIRRSWLFSLERNWLHVPEIREIPFDREIRQRGGLSLNRWKNLVPTPMKALLLRLTGWKRVIDEGQNLIFAGQPQTVKALCGDRNLWPETAWDQFYPDIARYTHQLSPHFATRLHIASGLISKYHGL